MTCKKLALVFLTVVAAGCYQPRRETPPGPQPDETQNATLDAALCGFFHSLLPGEYATAAEQFAETTGNYESWDDAFAAWREIQDEARRRAWGNVAVEIDKATGGDRASYDAALLRKAALEFRDGCLRVRK